MFALARRNGVRLPTARSRPAGGLPVHSTCRTSSTSTTRACRCCGRGGFRRLAGAYLGRAPRPTSPHAEIFFDPQAHTARGVDIRHGDRAACTGVERGARGSASEARLIMCFLRHLDEADALSGRSTRRCPIATYHRRRSRYARESATRRSKFTRVFARAAGRPAFSSPMPARKGRRPMSGRRSTCSASSASITAIAPWRTRRS